MTLEISEKALICIIVGIIVFFIVCIFVLRLSKNAKFNLASLALAAVSVMGLFSILSQLGTDLKMIEGQKFYLCLQVSDNGDLLYINDKYEEVEGHTDLSNAVAAGGDLNTYGKDIKFVTDINLLGILHLQVVNKRDVLYLNDPTATSLGVITQKEFDRRVDEWNSTLPASDSSLNVAD